MYTWGGPFFMISGCCYVLLDMGIPGLWLGSRFTPIPTDALGLMVLYLYSTLQLLLWLHHSESQAQLCTSLTMLLGNDIEQAVPPV